MKTLALYRSLGAIDIRSVVRDPLLGWMVVLTPGLGLLLRFAVPQATAALHDGLGFDFVPYYPLVMSFLPLVVAGMIGTVVGFLLLDQRDDQTLPALLVTPMSLADYIRYRLVVLVLASVVLSCLTMPLAALTRTTVVQLAVVSIVAAPIAPIYALFLASFANNKVQGFALVKAAGIVMLPCILAYFVAEPWQLALGFVPHYWPLKVFWLFDEGRPAASLALALVGIAWQSLLLILLTWRFARVVRQ